MMSGLWLCIPRAVAEHRQEMVIFFLCDCPPDTYLLNCIPMSQKRGSIRWDMKAKEHEACGERASFMYLQQGPQSDSQSACR